MSEPNMATLQESLDALTRTLNEQLQTIHQRLAIIDDRIMTIEQGDVGTGRTVSSNTQSNNVLGDALMDEFEHGSTLQINTERTPTQRNLCVIQSDQVLSHLNCFVAHKVFDCTEVDRPVVDEPIVDDLVIAGTIVDNTIILMTPS